MRALQFLPIAILLLAPPAYADSYDEFRDRIEIDRTGVVFANVEAERKSAGRERVSIRVWTMLHPALPGSPAGQTLAPQEQPSESVPTPYLFPGEPHVIHEQSFNFLPWRVRVSRTALALLDHYPINYGPLKRQAAVRIILFDGTRQHAIRLNDVFYAGVEKYHNGRGRVHWLHDAWFDESESNLIIVAQKYPSHQKKQEVAVISLADGRVRPATTDDIKKQLATVEKRYLHVAFQVAADHSLPGVDDVAKNILADDKSPLPARLRAAKHLWQHDDARGRKLIREVAALESHDPAHVKYDGLDNNLLFDPDYWWDTVGFAARAEREMSGREE